jgi:hypothetical protein
MVLHWQLILQNMDVCRENTMLDGLVSTHPKGTGKVAALARHPNEKI